MSEDENSLEGWMKVIEESSNRYRKNRDNLKEAHLAFMRDLIDHQEERTEGPVLTWTGNNPSIRKDRVEMIRNNDHALLSIFERMAYHTQWEENFEEVFPEVFEEES